MRLRVVKVLVQVVAMADDGETLHELNVSPAVVPWSEWTEWSTGGGLAAAIEGLREQVEHPDDPAA